MARASVAETLNFVGKVLARNNVDFCVAGALAIALYRPDRKTHDVDLVILSDNETKVSTVLHRVGFTKVSKAPSAGLEGMYFSTYIHDVYVSVDFLISDILFMRSVLRSAIRHRGFKVASPESMMVFKKISYPIRLVDSDSFMRFKGESDLSDYKHLIRTRQYNYVKLMKLARMVGLENSIREDIGKWGGRNA